jgi:aspartyl/glutamyl-tRNA(Asn/Gln) amidotransferase C subunit
MHIDENAVTALAGLAYLELSAEEKQAFPGQLTRLMQSVEKLSAPGTDGVQPMVYVYDTANAVREDTVQESAARREELLALAPANADSCFLVPRILE